MSGKWVFAIVAAVVVLPPVLVWWLSECVLHTRLVWPGVLLCISTAPHRAWPAFQLLTIDSSHRPRRASAVGDGICQVLEARR